ncbi:MAG: GCN5-related N-acetyltransferase [Thermoleophilia bacterium]|nr:GCN5-related N-acetyltransferase [Thermoleophilia bacterium]
MALAGAVLFVAEEDGRVVGNLGLHPDGAGSAALGMSVASSWRRHGIGTALLESAARWSREAGLRELRLEVCEANNPAVELYRKFGFVETTPPRPGERGAVLTMAKGL